MIARLFSPCLLGHGDWHYTRINGQLVKECARCQQPLGAVLAGEMIATPLPQNVAGEPTSHAQIVESKRARVTPLRVREQR